MIVITLTKVPNALRGDLTKWYQEIQTGVYVGTVSARIRDLLWTRIVENIGNGEATMVYNTNNEIGYQFKTTRQDHAVVDYDGIPLMMHLKQSPGTVKHGFSNASKFHRAKVMSRPQHQRQASKSFVAVDVETTGLDATSDVIISIGAFKRDANGNDLQLNRLIQTTKTIPQKIVELTGITAEAVQSEGVELKTALTELRDFIGSATIVGYNFRFDDAFLRSGFEATGQESLANEMRDLMPIVKKADKFLDNYRLETVLAKYDIKNAHPHHALSDAKATYKLAVNLTENRVF